MAAVIVAAVWASVFVFYLKTMCGGVRKRPEKSV